MHWCRYKVSHLEMQDYKTFLDFVLAIQNKETPQALAYFWKILDVNKQVTSTASRLAVVSAFSEGSLGLLDAVNTELFLQRCVGQTCGARA